MDPRSSLKVPVVCRPEYTIFLERFADMTWGHVDFHRTTPGAVRRFREDAGLLVALQGAPVFVTHRPEDQLHAKFLRLVGARFSFTTTDHAGLPVEVYQFS